ncbi:monocarboxylate transporter 12-like isoform X3 [Daphnia pulicaria]|uniref:monocarboxylate transporter 12-like isoform X3 n=1 Tax=Daphnia pulicaria TaxID=35523 RepID=UPI001EEBF724|nr:monocarboxylate transporter 12-like isoform X3 [Daphnia pulicaria]
MKAENTKKWPRQTNKEEATDEYVIVPPDGGYGWVVTVASFLCILISDGILYCFGLIISEVERVFDEPVAKTAWIFSIFNAISYFSGPVASALSNRFGFRVVVITGSLFGFVGLLTSAFAQSVENLFFTLGLLFGFAICLVFTPIIVNVSFYFDKKRALATGIAICGSGAGTFVFAPVVNWLLKTYALRGTFLILSGIYLNCGVFGALLIPLKPQRCNKVRSETVKLLEKKDTEALMFEKYLITKEIKFNSRNNLNVSEQEKVDNRTRREYVNQNYFSNFSKLFKFSLFRSPTLVVICVSSFFQSFGWLVPLMYLAAHAVNMGIPKEEASFLLSIIGICNMIGRIINGWLSDNPKVSVLFLNNMGLTVSGLLIMICPFCISYYQLLFFSIALGLFTSCTAVTRPILLGELLGLENVNNAYGFMLVFYGVATLFGIPMAGLLYDTLGDYHGAFYLAGSSILLSAFGNKILKA